MLRTLATCVVLLSSLRLALPDPPAARAPVRPAAPPAAPAAQEQDFADVVIRTLTVAEGLFMLQGAGGNMGLLVGDDGAFLVDDQYAPLTPKILAAVAERTDQPVRFVVNTHWHFDHTGGNENLGGQGAVIVAHDNVRARMEVEQVMEHFGRTVPAAPPVALPRLTFGDEVTFHWNGETVRVLHVPDAHTDGDALIRFEQKNVVHMGDCFFNGFYPYIDADSGGSIHGMIAAAERGLELCDDATKIIPGHGPLAGKAELAAFRDMLVAARDAIVPLVEQGFTREQVIDAKPTAELDPDWGDGFMAPDAWVGIVYDGLD